jgi:hypothetical protein
MRWPWSGRGEHDRDAAAAAITDALHSVEEAAAAMAELEPLAEDLEKLRRRNGLSPRIAYAFRHRREDGDA